MGVNVKCVFPYGTRVKDVGIAAAKLLGVEVVHRRIAGSDAIFASTSQVTYSPWRSEVTCCDIVIDLRNVASPAAAYIRESDGGLYRLGYHFEGQGGPLIMPKATAVKIALCAGLVKLFGGFVDYNDSDAKDINLRVKANPDRLAEDDPGWSRLNQSILDLPPITTEDIEKYSKWASY